jgi:hypothetical protein
MEITNAFPPSQGRSRRSFATLGYGEADVATARYREIGARGTVAISGFSRLDIFGGIAGDGVVGVAVSGTPLPSLIEGVGLSCTIPKGTVAPG